MRLSALYSFALAPLRCWPATAHAALVARAFNHFARGQALRTRLTELAGRRVCLHVSDVAVSFCFEIMPDGALRPARGTDFDVRVSGTAADFCRLAVRAEDSDTLFFHRRLCLEGDTDTGLHIKNLLDAFEFDLPAHLSSILGERAARGIGPALASTELLRRLHARAQAFARHLPEPVQSVPRDSGRS